eukprot:7726033-Ditylum_brightwellii.AAC.1
MSKGGFIMVTGGNGALGQSVIELAAIGCGARGIYATAQKENAHVVTKFVGLTFLQGKTVSGGMIVLFLGQLDLPDLLPPKRNSYA